MIYIIILQSFYVNFTILVFINTVSLESDNSNIHSPLWAKIQREIGECNEPELYEERQ